MAKRSNNEDGDSEQAIAPSFWGNSPAERTIWLALGYMEAAAHLANALVKDEFTRQYRSSRIVLHLTHHAIELFLKGALIEKGLPQKRITASPIRHIPARPSSFQYLLNYRALRQKRSFQKSRSLENPWTINYFDTRLREMDGVSMIRKSLSLRYA